MGVAVFLDLLSSAFHMSRGKKPLCPFDEICGKQRGKCFPKQCIIQTAHIYRDTRAAFFQDFTQPIIRDKLSLRHILQQGIAKPLLFWIAQRNIWHIEIHIFGFDDTRSTIQRFLDHIRGPVPNLFLDARQGNLPG